MRDFGDFQTPQDIVSSVLTLLQRRGIRWERVLEPTSGRGSFIEGLLAQERPPRDIIAIEIQNSHIRRVRELAQTAPTGVHVTALQANFFDVRLESLPWYSEGDLLVLGNPPWVTNSELGVLNSANTPAKTNVLGLAGLAAMTGASNFDLGTAVWLKLLTALAPQRPTIALLCKTSVARDVLRFARYNSIGIRDAAIYHIDAKRAFGAAVDACLFVLTVESSATEYEATIYSGLRLPSQYERTISVGGDLVVRDREAFAASSQFSGACLLEWRQGIKHDAAAVMELQQCPDGALINKRGEVVSAEEQYVFPLLKSSDLHRRRIRENGRRVIVPQRSLKEDLQDLQQRAPALFSYLNAHRGAFEARKSSIYRGKAPFSVFGIGPYSFASYKVAVAGLYLTPRFRVVGPYDGKPVLFDDTCYFAACDDLSQACLVAVLLNSEAALAFIASMTFSGSKRPITKALLQKIDLVALLEASEDVAIRDRMTETAAEVTSFSPLAGVPVAGELREVLGIADQQRHVALQPRQSMLPLFDMTNP